MNDREGLRQAGKVGPGRGWESLWERVKEEKEGGRVPQTPGGRALKQRKSKLRNRNYNGLPGGSVGRWVAPSWKVINQSVNIT